MALPSGDQDLARKTHRSSQDKYVQPSDAAPRKHRELLAQLTRDDSKIPCKALRAEASAGMSKDSLSSPLPSARTTETTSSMRSVRCSEVMSTLWKIALHFKVFGSTGRFGELATGCVVRVERWHPTAHARAKADFEFGTSTSGGRRAQSMTSSALSSLYQSSASGLAGTAASVFPACAPSSPRRFAKSEQKRV